MDKPGGTRHWLDRYGTGYHAWIRDEAGFSRPCGLVELMFDADGRYFGGRADVSSLLTVGISTRLLDEGLRHHVLLAFALLRLRHCLLAARAELRTLEVEPWFSVRVPVTADAAIRDAGRDLRFLDPAVDGVDGGAADVADFYAHAQNVARIVRPSEGLARVFVFPVEEQQQQQADGGGSRGARRRIAVRFLFVIAHEIVDGLSCMNWLSDFTGLLNMSAKQIRRAIEAAISPAAIRARLPPAQEDLYAPVAATTARTRWFWAITVALRRARKPLPAAFPNPLRRATPLATARPFAPRYPTVLDYSRTPPLNTFFIEFQLSPAASQRLYRLCREAGASVGAGGFVLVGMAMMALHEALHPDEAAGDAARRPFIGGFPLNARPLMAGAPRLGSAMLAFCRGVVLPFLPSHLDLEGRFRLLVRQATRQLAAYRTRDRGRGRGRDKYKDKDGLRQHHLATDADAIAYMGLDGAGRVLALNYIDGIENLRGLLPSNLRDHVLPSPLGEHVVPTWTVGSTTCVVSSVGRVDWSRARFDLDADPNNNDEGGDVIASVESLRSGVRVRENEFLVGTWSEDGLISCGVSFDGNFVDEERARRWVEMMRALLEVSDVSGAQARL
ncbi:hypothetical protein F5B17DRAFT_406145 [Nemania serpens]|nr:hypothetical protein F5B17DRAFT_406145 [Nemania serpens]